MDLTIATQEADWNSTPPKPAKQYIINIPLGAELKLTEKRKLRKCWQEIRVRVSTNKKKS